MSHYVVVLRDGVAKVIETDDPNGITEVRLDSYLSRDEAEQRRDIENDPHKRALFHAGKLKVKKSK